MGVPKQHALDRGRSLGTHMLALADACCGDVVVSGPEEAIAGREHIADLPAHAGWGPLAGIEAVLADGRADRWLVLPCDMPSLEVHDIRSLINAEGDVCCFARTHELREPLQLPMVVAASVLDVLQAHLDAGGRSLCGWLDRVGVTLVPPPPAQHLRNANRPSDLIDLD